MELAFLKTLTKESYQAIQKGTDVSAKAIVKLVPVGADVKWEEYKVLMDKHLEDQKYFRSESEALDELRTGLPLTAAFCYRNNHFHFTGYVQPA